MRVINKIMVIGLMSIFNLSCTTTEPGVITHGPLANTAPQGWGSDKGKLDYKQQMVIDAAMSSLKMGYPNELLFNDTYYTNDCSGLIYGIYSSAGINIIALTSGETGNGVKRMYSLLHRRGLVHKKKLPSPGDLIFWDNTYGTWGGNPLSHVGVVVGVEEDGTVEFVHNNTYLGKISLERMNLYKPSEKLPYNHYMRYDSKYKKTAGELFSSFGMAWRLE